MALQIETPELHRLSIDEYHQLIASGGLDADTRVELIDGFIVDMSPRSPQHENAVRWLLEWLARQLDWARYQLIVAGPLTIGSSEPEPDLAIVERSESKLEHPSSALLVVEVAVSSKDRDLRVKPALYAAAVQEYWVVDLEGRRVVVHRHPGDGRYTDIETLPEGTELSAEALELSSFNTDELFAFAFAERTKR